MIPAFALTVTTLPFCNRSVTGSFPLSFCCTDLQSVIFYLDFVGKNYIVSGAILTIWPNLVEDYGIICNCHNVSFLSSFLSHILVVVRNW